jgi:anti-sigma factor RsiW
MTHEEIVEILPWYVNATLSEQERREVSEHLASCTPCQAELEEMTVLQQAVVESAGEMPAPSRSLLKEAMAQVDSFERARQPVRARSASWLSELQDRLGDALLGWCGPMPNFARAVVAAQFLLIAGLAGGLGFSLWDRQYSTLSGTAQTAAGARLAIRFNESVTEAQLRQVLREIDGKIVDGPSSLGIYTVEVPIAPEKTAELDKLLQALRNKQQFVTYVEKVG